MATVLNKNTMELRRSVNTPDYPSKDWIVNPDLSAVESVPRKYWKLSGNDVVEMNQSEKDAKDASMQPPAREVARKKIEDALAFAAQMKKDFIIDNILLGITEKGLTNHVRRALQQVDSAMASASLYDARLEISKIPSTALDPHILTDARLLEFRNKIEDYLGLDRATAYEEKV